jgi:oligopeptide transport system substrate-binding protein
VQFLHYLAFVKDFTHFEDKLVFSLNLRIRELMSKPQKSMQQVTEIASVRASLTRQVFEFLRVLVRCGMIFAAIFGATGCGGRTGTPGNDASVATRPTESDASKATRMLRRGMPGEPSTLDPQLADDTFSSLIVRDLFEGLTAEDRDGRIVPGAARSWSVDPTGTIYTFQLRPDAKWSDGDRTVASEFVQGLRRAVDPLTASGSAGLLVVIKGASEIIAGHKKVTDLGVIAVDESVVRIELEHPAPFVLEILSQPIAAPMHIPATSASAVAKSPEHAHISNGPYTLISRVPGSFIELARNPKYWDAANVLIERVRYINEESEATELREYMAGQLDLTYTIPAPDFKRAMEKYAAEIQTSPILGTLYLALNVSVPPLRDHIDLRQALSMAVDRDLICEHVALGVTPAYSFVARGISGYNPPTYQWAEWTHEHQLAYAKQLFAHSGYSQKNPLRLKLYFNTGETIQRIMIAIAGSWKQNLGVESELISDEFRVFLEGRKNRSRWDVARLGWWPEYKDPASFLEVFSSSSSQNDPGYINLEFSKLIDASRVASNPDERFQILHRSEEVLLNDYPIIPIYFYTARRLVKPYVGGAVISPLNRTYSKHLFWKDT